MIFQSLESNKLCHNLKSHLFREKSHSYFVKLKKKCTPSTGLERLISDSLAAKNYDNLPMTQPTEPVRL